MTSLLLLFMHDFSKRGTFLLIAIRRSAFGFRRFIDFVLIDRRELNPDSHKYVVANGMKTCSAFPPSVGKIGYLVLKSLGDFPPGNFPPGNFPPDISPPENSPPGHIPPGHFPPVISPPYRYVCMFLYVCMYVCMYVQKN